MSGEVTFGSGAPLPARDRSDRPAGPLAAAVVIVVVFAPYARFCEKKSGILRQASAERYQILVLCFLCMAIRPGGPAPG